ncbi:MAG TPA: site-specific integrase [Gemmataceae bacterium]|nr:site-specific integrase [Gemmataceae bacterium]
MASLQCRPGKDGKQSWRILFRYNNALHSFTLDETDQVGAIGAKAQIEELLRLLKRRLIDLPAGCTIEHFLYHRGKPPRDVEPVLPKEATLAEVRDAYVRTHENGAIEQTTLATCKMHLAHLIKALGASFPVNALSLKELQEYVDRRSKAKGRGGKPISPVTIRKEVVTFSTVWTFARRMGMVSGKFPSEGLRYPKAREPLPFMNREQVESQLAGSADPDELWDCLYLELPEIAELLEYVKEHAAQPFVFPMFAFACHTGARRSEMIRAEVRDIDFADQAVIIREKKRARGKLTTRRVPLTPYLAGVLKEWLAQHPKCPALFCQAGVVARSKKRSTSTGHKSGKKRPGSLKARLAGVRHREELPPAALTRKEAHYHFQRTLAGSKWEVLKGWHCLRHSFISACASRRVDQRLIDEWVGHNTEEQRKRYRHLYPSTQQEAIADVFKAPPPDGKK